MIKNILKYKSKTYREKYYVIKKRTLCQHDLSTGLSPVRIKSQLGEGWTKCRVKNKIVIINLTNLTTTLLKKYFQQFKSIFQINFDAQINMSF
jgi:hypothetical protein